MKQISFYLEDETWEKIQEMAKKQHRNFSDQLRYILSGYQEESK